MRKSLTELIFRHKIYFLTKMALIIMPAIFGFSFNLLVQ